MEKQIDAWLKTYRNEATIAPADWEELPEECRIRLDQHARDRSVTRADQLARDGRLDLRNQDAIRDLVDAMALCWRLPGEDVRRVVEAFYDELPPKPGEEFEKLAKRLFRNRVTANWSELRRQASREEIGEIVGFVLPYVDEDGDHALDRTAFLKHLRHGYDLWSMEHPTEAVNELWELLVKEEEEASIEELLPYIRMRGAAAWAKSMSLEQELDVETVKRPEMIRILKRYAILFKKGQLDQDMLPETLRTQEDHIAESAEPSEAEQPDVEEQDASDRTFPDGNDEDRSTPEHAFDNSGEILEQELMEVAGEAEDDSAEENRVSAEDEQQLLNDGPILEETNAVADEEHPLPAHESEREYPDEDEEAARLLFGSGEAPSDPDINGSYRQEEQEAAVEGGEQPRPPLESALEKWSFQTQGESEAPPQKIDLPEQGGDEDRFSVLRSGELRDRIVETMYEGNGTLLDVFLAKLSGAPDWNRAKQFIANEFFRNKIDLHSELGEEYFLTLKDCLNR